MKPQVTVSLLAVALLVFAAAPVQADGANANASAQGQERSEEARNQTKAAAATVVEEACRLIYIYTRAPSVMWDPLLGIVDFDPDGCYIVEVDGPFFNYTMTYDGR